MTYDSSHNRAVVVKIDESKFHLVSTTIIPVFVENRQAIAAPALRSIRTLYAYALAIADTRQVYYFCSLPILTNYIKSALIYIYIYAECLALPQIRYIIKEW